MRPAFEEFQWDKYAELFEGRPGLDLTEQNMDVFLSTTRAKWGILSILSKHDYLEPSERRAAQVPVANQVPVVAEDAPAAAEDVAAVADEVEVMEEDAEELEEVQAEEEEEEGPYRASDPQCSRTGCTSVHVDVRAVLGGEEQLCS